MELPRNVQWLLVSSASALLASALVRGAAQGGWRLWKGEDPPMNPAAGDTSWTDALVWAGATSLGVAVGRVVAYRAATGGWRMLRGESPPGV